MCGAPVCVDSSKETASDHQVVFVPYLVRDEADTLDGIVRNDPDEIESASVSPVLYSSGELTATLRRMECAVAQRRDGVDGS